MSKTNTPLDFQKATAERIYQLFTDPKKPRQRVLLADEVGLGKTTVASAVVQMMGDYEPFKADQFYRVVYVCSNINIARQNISQFGIEDRLSVDESRLSMQHLVLSSKEKKIIEANKTETPEIIIPLTPFTSFNFASNCGSAQERALIYAYLSRLTDVFGGLEDALSEYLMTKKKSPDNWESCVSSMNYRIDNDITAEDRDDVIASVRKKGIGLLNDVKRMLQGDKAEWEYGRFISPLRQMFADISLDRLAPDLVIMDEFQRFKSLLSDNNDEQSIIARKFFGNPDVKILLLSATPYKPYSTIDELNESGVDEHFSDFKQVVNFLAGGDTEELARFNTVWSRYNLALSQISLGNLEILNATKQDAEDSLYGMMCRTERFNTGNVTTKEIDVKTSDADVRSYFQTRLLLDTINEKSDRHDFTSVPIEYIKSSPYIFSFMEGYKLKKFVQRQWESTRISKDLYNSVYLPYHKVNGFGNVPLSNGKLDYLTRSLMAGGPIYKDHPEYGNGYSSEKLLWIPASHPYYQTHGVYSKNRGFSKVLIFSSWEMVPRMLSVMLTYSSEKKVMDALRERKYSIKRYFNNEGGEKQNRYGVGRLKLKDEDNPLLYPSRYLAGLFAPEDKLGKDINDIKASVKCLLKTRLDRLEIPYGGRFSAQKLRSVMELLDGIEVEGLDAIPDEALDILSDAAIASPAVCALRAGCNEDEAITVANYFLTLFTRSESAAIVDICYSAKSENYIDAVLDYCVEGNLQSVLDEYLSILGKDKWLEFFSGAPTEAVTLDVYMQNEYGDILRKGMRTSYAVQFANSKMESKAVNRVANIRTAFNSPFRPFVLATTSVGQEGLDFHQYSRKLVHWNLPSNPVDMEQREGRVNRYRNLSIRQRLAAKYHDTFFWKDIFEKAKNDYKGNYSDMVPSWNLPPEFEDDGSRTVERIILNYPLSVDTKKYARLEKVLSLYRLTLGQPRQEKLIELLSKAEIGDDEMNQLVINLCPFKKRRLPGCPDLSEFADY